MGASKVVNFFAKTKLQVWNAFLSPFSPPKGPVIIYHLGGGSEDFFFGGGDQLIFRRTEGVSFAIENPQGRIIEIISNNSEGPLKSVGKCQFRSI